MSEPNNNLPDKIEDFIEQIDKLFDDEKSDPSITHSKLVEGFKKYDPEEKNFELLWRIAKAAYKVSFNNDF